MPFMLKFALFLCGIQSQFRTKTHFVSVDLFQCLYQESPQDGFPHNSSNYQPKSIMNVLKLMIVLNNAWKLDE